MPSQECTLRQKKGNLPRARAVIVKSCIKLNARNPCTYELARPKGFPWNGGETRMIEAKIGRRVKALREQHHVSQAVLAEHLGLNDRQSVSDIENGKRKLAANELVLIIERFGRLLMRSRIRFCFQHAIASRGGKAMFPLRSLIYSN